VQTKNRREGRTFAPATEPDTALGDAFPGRDYATTAAAIWIRGDAAAAKRAKAARTNVAVKTTEGRVVVIGGLQGSGFDAPYLRPSRAMINE